MSLRVLKSHGSVYGGTGLGNSNRETCQRHYRRANQRTKGGTKWVLNKSCTIDISRKILHSV